MDFVGAASLQRVQFIAQPGSEFDVGARPRAAGLDAEVRQNCVDAVDAGAGHQSDEELGAH
jgi:hypothetical protein